MAFSKNQLVDLYSEAFQNSEDAQMKHYISMLDNAGSLRVIETTIGWTSPTSIRRYDNGLTYILKDKISEFYPASIRQTVELKMVDGIFVAELKFAEDESKFKDGEMWGPPERIPPERVYAIEAVRVAVKAG